MTAVVVEMISRSPFAGFLSGFITRFDAFFEEQGRAIHRAHRDFPFGL
ncbi:hypothetical protein [Hansschlegelia beijingensis]|uniref:Uncharacterized protein n=1 Tax=Hansschlegelia beijingensis TaxID=1133344 RepID=A0A7W6GFX1_9HYPH|nr:hypothetical protein [Hansschlegelia beijingensis]MBB3972094.1 hypothetical protein [Hansschlegelia beijingensis]